MRLQLTHFNISAFLPASAHSTALTRQDTQDSIFSDYPSSCFLIMKKFSARFLTLLLVLLSIGAFDLHALLQHAQGSDGHIKASSGLFASAAPLYTSPEASSLQARSTKPRVGIVVKGNSNFKSPTPLNTLTTGGSKSSSSAFQNADGRVGMTVQLKRLERNQASNPLMVSYPIFPHSLLLTVPELTKVVLR